MSKKLYSPVARQMTTRRPSDSSQQGPEGNLDFEINFFEGLLADSPDFVEALVALAEAYTRKGWHRKGLETDEKITRLCPGDPVAHYNLACSHALLGQLDAAMESLKKSLALGYRDLRHLEQDKDLENLRKDSRLRELLSRFFPPKADRTSNQL